MKAGESSGASCEEGPNPRLFPRINQLAKISFFIGIGDVIGGIYTIFVNGDVDMVPLLLIALLPTSVVGAFCGHFFLQADQGAETSSARQSHGRGWAYWMLCLSWVFLFWALAPIAVLDCVSLS